MAENNNYTVQYNFGDLVNEVAGLKTAVVSGSIIGGAAIVAGAVVAWFVITTQMETNSAIGELKGERSVVVILEDIQKTLKGLSTEGTAPKSESAPSAPQKQGSLENLPMQMGNWTGVEGSSDDLANALLKSPAKGPVVVYTENPDEAAKIKSMIDAQ